MCTVCCNGTLGIRVRAAGRAPSSTVLRCMGTPHAVSRHRHCSSRKTHESELLAPMRSQKLYVVMPRVQLGLQAQLLRLACVPVGGCGGRRVQRAEGC